MSSEHSGWHTELVGISLLRTVRAGDLLRGTVRAGPGRQEIQGTNALASRSHIFMDTWTSSGLTGAHSQGDPFGASPRIGLQSLSGVLTTLRVPGTDWSWKSTPRHTMAAKVSLAL